MAEAENIRVAVRCRPMSKKEINEQAESCFTCKNGNAVLTNPDNKDEVHEFGFDFVYPCETEQCKVFNDFGQPVLQRAFGGYNGTIFAYGQTGSGKTFSMAGIAGNEELEGLISRMNKALFDHVQAEKTNSPNKLFLVECSFFEIYNEIIYDLLDSSPSKDKKNKGLEIKEHSVLGIYVKDLQERVVESRDEVLELMAQGQANRTVGYTNMNSESSRSHSIFVIKIHQKDSLDESKNVFAKVNLVDLAGSERAAGTGAVGTRLKEGANINKSLSALGNVINALVEDARTGKKSFIPYRNSKLTRESLGGNSLCSMLATLSPANINFIETLGTLKYASRAKSIKVNAKKNEEASQISQLNEEIAALKKRLMEQQSISVDPVEKNEMIARFEKQIQEMDAVRLQTWEDKAKLSKQHELERKKLAKEKARADQKTQDEKVKKWKLLEAKADIELAMRATRELDVGTESWIHMAAKAKALEQDVKDARTLICVFKDSLDKDVVNWKGTDDDASSVHVTANQLCTKIKNIQEESAKMMALESELLRQTSAVLDAIATEMDMLQRSWTTAVATTPPPTKEAKVLYEDRDKALSITMHMVQAYRAALLSTLKAERKRIFNMHDAAKLLSNELQAQVESPHMADDRKKARIMALKSLAGALEAISDASHASKASGNDAPPAYEPKGDAFAFGLEKRLLGDDRLSASSGDAKAARLHGSGCWAPSTGDLTPWLRIDLEKPRFVSSVSVQGGVLGQASAEDPSLDLSKERMEAVLSQVAATAVSGDHDQTYEIAKHIMSWVKLLKSPQIPTKLFSRPPVRFLHDVITQVAVNTGYGKDVFFEKDRDYNQLTEKKDKVEYLLKVLQLVQTTFQGVLEVKATDANILAGKEPEQTMQLLGLFCLGAIQHVATHGAPVPQEAWITQLQIESSVDGETWGQLPAPVTANADVTAVVVLALPPNTVARYIKLLPTKWQNTPALRVEVTGMAAVSADTGVDAIQAEILGYLGLLTNLFSAGELVLEEAKVKWAQAKDSQREKQTALNNLVQEMDTWKAQTQMLQANLDAANKAIDKWKADKGESDTKLSAATAQIQVIAAQCKATEDHLAQAKATIDALTTQCAELTQANTAVQHQQTQLQAQLTSMTQSKADLEKLSESLRTQLSSKSALEGATDSRMASLSAELQTVTIQLDEAKRNVERTAKALAEAEAEKAAASQQIKALKLDATTKDRANEAIEAKFKADVADLQRQQAATNAALQESTAQRSEVEDQAQRAQALLASLQAELDAIKKRQTENATSEIKRLQDEASEAEKRYFSVQTQQVRLQADNERLEAKFAAADEKVRVLDTKLLEATATIESLQREKKALEELEEELNLQLQVVTEERDSARQKEEILFFENAEKDQEIERIRDGYVWVTDRMNNKEDELAELQEQIEKYQSLLRLSTSSETPSRPSSSQPAAPSVGDLTSLYRIAFHKDCPASASPSELLQQITHWMRAQSPVDNAPPERPTTGPSSQNVIPSEPPAKPVTTVKPAAVTPAKPPATKPEAPPTFVTQGATHTKPPEGVVKRQVSIEDLSPPMRVESKPVLVTGKSVASEIYEDNEYDDDFDAADDDDGAKRAKSKRRSLSKGEATVEPVPVLLTTSSSAN